MVGRSSLPRSGRSSDARRSEAQLGHSDQAGGCRPDARLRGQEASQNSGQTQATTTAEILPTARSQKRTRRPQIIAAKIRSQQICREIALPCIVARYASARSWCWTKGAVASRCAIAGCCERPCQAGLVTTPARHVSARGTIDVWLRLKHLGACRLRFARARTEMGHEFAAARPLSPVARIFERRVAPALLVHFGAWS